MPDQELKGLESLTSAEHISPDKTGDNIQAKRVANYTWNGSAWERQSSTSGGGDATAANQVLIIDELETINSLTPSVYDYIDLTYTGDNLTGVVFKSGGSGGTTVSTLTLAYTGARLDSVTKS